MFGKLLPVIDGFPTTGSMIVLVLDSAVAALVVPLGWSDGDAPALVVLTTFGSFTLILLLLDESWP